MQILEIQPTEAAPYLVADYPYGFRLRCQIRYWIETTKNGQRFVSQTLNPKNQRWNKPKKSTYAQIMLMGLDEKNYVTYTAISMYSLEEAKKFQEKYGQYLSEYQKTELQNMIKMLEVYSKVTYECKSVRYKNMRTGEISTCINMFDLADVVEVNDLGDPVDKKAEEKIREYDNRMVNIAALKNAAGAGDIHSALDTFKRSV